MDQRKNFGVEVDMISWLPDELLLHILSSLPLQTSVSTSILSRRWLHLWKHTTKLIITNQNSADDNVNWVNSVLKSHIAPSLQELTIDFHVTESNLHEVAKWLDFAFSRRVENLRLNFRARESIAPSLHKIIALVPTSDGMQSLKSLRLEETKINSVDIHFFLGKCPLLEELVIRRAAIVSDHFRRVVGIWRQLKRLDLEEGEITRVSKAEFRHSSLKRFKLMCSRCDDHILLVRHVVESCVALEEIQISRECDDIVRAATTEERASFENTTRTQLPAHIKLSIANHSHV